MPDRGPATWVADPAIAWRILLTAEVSVALDVEVVRDRLARLHTDQGWPGTGTVEVAADSPGLADLRRRLGDARDGVVAVGLDPAGTTIVVSAHHSRVDGLGLLAVLAAVTGVPVASSVRGVGDRPDGAGPVGTVVRRLAEVAVTPPAAITVVSPPTGADPLDVYVERDVPGEVRTAELVAAAARGVVAHNRAAGTRRRTRHVAVAVGVTRAGATRPIADHSALLRLRDVESLDLDAVTDALRNAPTQHAVQASGGGAGVMRLGLRLLAPRLGSTLLVSHLGRVQAEGVTSLTFHPVTAGGTGVSLGAAGLASPDAHDSTTLRTRDTRITLRARGSQWTHDGLERVLEAVVAELG